MLQFPLRGSVDNWEMATSSWASSPATRRAMISNRSRDTGPELAVRRALFARGLRYRVNVRPVPGLRRTGDIVFPRKHVVLFIDGCFWHGCTMHYREPKTNLEYWRSKISRNVERDAETDGLLERAGWIVVRFWSHEAVGEVVDRVCALVQGLPPSRSLLTTAP